jgi:hypothetical protein
MSNKKHQAVLSQLSAHPIARNIEWSSLIPALSWVGLLHTESNGNYHFTRNGHTLVLEQPRQKMLELEDVLKVRHFMRQSAHAPNDTHAADGVIVAISNQHAFVCHDPNTITQTSKKYSADKSHGRLLHTHPTSAPFNDASPHKDTHYYDAIIKGIKDDSKIVVLSHGTGSSNAATTLLDVMRAKSPQLVQRVVAVKDCDLEAMTEPQLIELGVELLHGKVATLAS